MLSGRRFTVPPAPTFLVDRSSGGKSLFRIRDFAAARMHL
jgi:hypothetical protein